jgi:hypothetical protein
LKEFKFKKPTPNGNVDGIFRSIGKFIYFKYNSSEPANKVINEFRKKGINIQEGKGWLKIDLFGSNEAIKLRDIEIDIEEDEEIIEEKLFNFYKNEYKRLGFYVDEGDANGITS